MSLAKVLSVALAVSMALTGPVAVMAQSKEPEAAPKAPAETAAAQKSDTSSPEDAAYKVGAGVATVINVPMRTGLCALGAAGGLVTLIVTFGSGYRFAARVVEEGCGGPWIITPEHLKGTKE
jgi:hypothetical protein